MFYRVLQFAQAIFPNIHPKDRQWALKHLSSSASELFLSQALADQRHAIDVAQSIIKARHPLSGDDFKNLVTAALLHDCGKSVVSIPLWQRVYIVLIQKLPVALKTHLLSGPAIFSVPLKIDARHPLWGAYLAEQAGLSSDICQIIREHHQPQTQLGSLLKVADNKH